jgi:hypothetical protein
MTDHYSYTINECQVDDFDALRAFREKRSQWKQWLDDDREHAIWPALLGMVWRDVSFATIGKLAMDNPEGPLTTSLIAEAIIHGHVAQQVLAIRRLTDIGKGRISLLRLIMDVKKFSRLLTRQNLVCFDGLPYDYEAVAEADYKSRPPNIAYWGATKGPEAWGTSQIVHKSFDRVSGIDHVDRQRNDRIPEALFTRMERIVKDGAASKISSWSHAYLAHAGSPLDRQEVADIQITNDGISTAIRELVSVTELMSNSVLGIGGYRGSVMPTPQYDIFEKLDNPVATEPGQVGAAELWETKSREWDASLDDIESLFIDAHASR